MNMKTSAAGRAALMTREGVRLTVYRDSVGVLTIGCGHTGRASAPPVTAGMTITQDQADQFLAADLAEFEAAVNESVTAVATQNQFDAMVSLAFNIGATGFRGSTVVHKINQGLVLSAGDAFLMWEKPPELKKRREGERIQFLTPDTAIKAAAVDNTKVLPTSHLVVPMPPVAPPKAPAAPPVTPPITVAAKPSGSMVSQVEKGANMFPAPAPGFWTRLWASFVGKRA